MKNERMAAWAAQKAGELSRQIIDMPSPKDWRGAQNKARAVARLRAREARLRRLTPQPYDETLPF